MKIALGLDCGGSNSRALAWDEDGTEVFRGQSGAANLVSTPHPVLARNLKSALEGCPPVDAVCGCFAGLLTDADRQTARALLEDLTGGAPVRAEPDYVAGFMACAPGTHLTVLSGTGSLVCSRNPDGSFTKTGGGGFLLGDEGSAFAIGRAGISALLLDGAPGLCKTRSSLLKAHAEPVESQLTPDRVNIIIAAIYRAGARAAEVAKFAEYVVADARHGDELARQIVCSELDKLADRVARHLQAVPNHLNIGLVGGVWKMGSLTHELFEVSLNQRLPGVTLRLARAGRPPVEGAVALAREMLI